MDHYGLTGQEPLLYSKSLSRLEKETSIWVGIEVNKQAALFATALVIPDKLESNFFFVRQPLLHDSM